MIRRPIAPLTLGSVALLAACAGAPPPPAAMEPSRPLVAFPSRETLRAIPAKPVPPASFEGTSSSLEAWSRPSEGGDDRTDDEKAWTKALREAKGNAATVSPALTCAARDLARFVAAKQGMPDARLTRFLEQRCGATHVSLAVRSRYGAFPEKAKLPPAEVEKLRTQLVAGIEPGSLEEGMEIGIGFAREPEGAAAVVLYGRARAEIEPSSLAVKDGAATIDGTLRVPGELVMGFVNQGRAGVALCRADAKIALPRFSLRCPVDPADAYAAVDVVSRTAKNVLLEPVAHLVVSGQDRAALTYTSPRADEGSAPIDGATFASAYVTELNHARAARGLPAFEHAAPQSEANAAYAGALLDAEAQHDEATATQITLGLMAGWEVPKGPISDAGILTVQVAPVASVGDVIQYSLAMPMGRWVLLRPGGGLLAVGPSIVPDKQGVAAVVTTYQVYDSLDHRADEAALRARIQIARQRLGLAPIAFVDADPATRDLLPLVADGRAQPGYVLQHLMTALAGRGGGAVSGYRLEMMNVELAPLPPELLGPNVSEVMLCITHHKPEGAAWGQLVGFVAFAADGSATRSASAEGAGAM
jgi:hypothetical protein